MNRTIEVIINGRKTSKPVQLEDLQGLFRGHRRRTLEDQLYEWLHERQQARRAVSDCPRVDEVQGGRLACHLGENAWGREVCFSCEGSPVRLPRPCPKCSGDGFTRLRIGSDSYPTPCDECHGEGLIEVAP